jgi:hypothetical protein
MNHSIAENFMRSANAPQISAGVMIAKVIWKHMYTDSGMVGARCDTATFEPLTKLIPDNKKRSALPRYALPGVNARL